LILDLIISKKYKNSSYLTIQKKRFCTTINKIKVLLTMF
jgi:hypothetical protein